MIIWEAVRAVKPQANVMEIKIYLCVTSTGSNRCLHLVKFIFSSIFILFSLLKNSCFLLNCKTDCALFLKNSPPVF